MNHSLVVLALFTSLLMSSCGNKETDKKEDKPEDKKEQSMLHHGKQANMLADISISGVCKDLNCLGSLKKLFSAMAGVVEFDFYFNEKTATNHAKVKFDNCKINDKQLISAIEKMDDGAFKAEIVELKKLQKKACPVKNKPENEEVSTASFTDSKSSSGSGGFALPSILDVFDVL